MKNLRQNKAHKRLLWLCSAGLIAALYVALTWLAMALGLHNNAVQVRFSEALCGLAYFTPAAIPGMTIGCLLANILTGCAPLDIFLGPVATLIGAFGNHLKGLFANQKLGDIALDNALDGFHRFFANRTTADSYNAEYRLDIFKQSVDVAKIIERCNGNGALRAFDLKAAKMLGTVTQIAAQGIFKIAAVRALEHDLAQFAK
jgi:hypothetical protein